MEILVAAACGLILDLLLGDPAWMPHPVVAMGRGITALERCCAAFSQRRRAASWQAVL